MRSHVHRWPAEIAGAQYAAPPYGAAWSGKPRGGYPRPLARPGRIAAPPRERLARADVRRPGRLGLLLLAVVLLAACQGTPGPTAMPLVTSAAAGPAAPAGPTPTWPPATAVPLGPVQVPGGQYINVSSAEMWAMLQHKDFLLINTHAPYEVEIAPTDAHIPVDAQGQWLARYPADKTTPIVLYCRSARWSNIAARELVKAGYVNVWHLHGGMLAWNAAGYPLRRR